MLPQHNYLTKSSNKTIHINPNFQRPLATTATEPAIPKNAHINPLFLEGNRTRPTIHMNPAFLLKIHEQQQSQHIANKALEAKKSVFSNMPVTSTSSGNFTIIDTRKIICKSKNRLIREPLDKTANKPFMIMKPITQPPFLVLNRRKLIRKAGTLPVTPNTTIKPLKNVNIRSNLTRYKLDNRVKKKKTLLPPTPKIKRTSFVGRYALRRSSSLSLTIGSTGGNKKSTSNATINKNLQLLNINGLLYKSTRNSLKLKETTKNTTTSKTIPSTIQKKPLVGNGSTSKTSQGLTIFVRGTKYVMDANKFKLTRVANATTDPSLSPTKIKANNSTTTSACRKRIDIGGYTFISANSSKNVFVRSTNHLARAYVHNAKQKSLQMLTRRLTKTNIPCRIYQRVGKCAAFERGRCSKVHNKLQVAICSNFLYGECFNSKCLLSHNVSLSKMPVCKFFLQGVCVRNDCPYLHKKLSNTAEICIDFLRGFCQLADKCNKRHEFVCPEIERNCRSTTKNCIYCKTKLKKEKQLEKLSENLQKSVKNPIADVSSNLRYFIEPCAEIPKNGMDIKDHGMEADISNTEDIINENSEEHDEHIQKGRPKLGALPAFIPL